MTVRVTERIPFGHKYATQDIKEGDVVLKYGDPIGVATKVIPAGSHVHVHCVESGRDDR